MDDDNDDDEMIIDGDGERKQTNKQLQKISQQHTDHYYVSKIHPAVDPTIENVWYLVISRCPFQQHLPSAFSPKSDPFPSSYQ